MKLQRKLSFIAFVSGAIITLLGLIALYYLAKDSYLEQTLEQISITTRSNAAMPIEDIRRAENSIVTLSEELKLSLAQTDDPNEIEEFDRITAADEFGVIRNKRDLFDGSRQAGVFIPADLTLTDDIKRTKLRAMKVLSNYGQAALQFFDGVWFDQANKSSVIFWRRDAEFIYKLTPDHDYTQTLWNTLASPELNPNRTIKWTPAIQEDPVGTWVVSCVYPLDIAGQWIGVLGHDIALTSLVKSFKQQDAFQHSQHFLLDSYGGFILAGPWQQQLEQASGEFKPDLNQEPMLEKLLTHDNTLDREKPIFQKITLQDQDYAAFTVNIPGLEWRYVRLVLIDELLKPMHELFINIALLMVLIAFLTALLINKMMRKWVVNPLINFAYTAENYARGDYERRFTYELNDELGDLTSTFNFLANNIQSQQRELFDSQHQYQHLVNSIHEVIFRLDNNGKLSLVNTSWTTVMGYSLDESINHYLTDFIHPEFIAEIEENLTALCQQKLEHYHGDVKFITSDQQTIWLDLELLASNDIDENNLSMTVIAGNMDDITDRKYASLIDKLIYDMDQQALQGISLDQIMTVSCIDLAEILSLNLIWVADPNIENGQVIASGGPDISKLQQYVSQIFSSDKTNEFNSVQKLTVLDELAGQGLAIPLRWPNNEHQAVIFFHAQSGYTFSDQDIKRLGELSHKIGITLQLAQDQKWMLLYRAAVENAANAILITDATGVIEWCNSALSRLTGYEVNEIIGKSPSFLHAQESTDNAYLYRSQDQSNLDVWHGEIINQHKDGSIYYAVETITPLLDERGTVTHFVSVQEDVSELKAAEEHMQHQATHDHLTGLPNRLMFHDRLDHAINVAKRNQTQHAILFMDLDGFKNINDSLGHQTGDMLLQQLAHRLTKLLRVSDTAARLGGDEFILLLECYYDVNTVAQTVEKVLSLFNEPFIIQGKELKLTTSIGVSLFPQDGTTADELISHADAAMYHAKALGRNNSQFFTDTINQKIQERLTLEQDMRTALEKEQFQLHYQPQINASDNTIIGMEALIRWIHPEKGHIPPVDFIPFAEETGYIVTLGQWVLITACKQAKIWQDQGYSELTVSINISAIQVTHVDFIESVKVILEQTQVNPSQVILELTESIMLTQSGQAILLLNELKDLGFKLSIDDFGTGYSSLQYLKMLPLDELKIDQSFIRDIHLRDGYAIVSSICALGKSMGLSLIAEGVEEPDTIGILNKLGCDHCQGYFYSKPLAVTDASNYLQTNN